MRLMQSRKDELKAELDHAKRAVGSLETQQDYKTVLRALDEFFHSSPAVRSKAVFDLRKLGISGAHLVVHALKDPDLEVRRKAVDCLSEIGGNVGLTHLYTAAQDPEIQGRAIDAIIKIGHADSIPVLLSQLNSKSRGVRLKLASAIKSISPARVVPKLTGMLVHDDNPVVRAGAANVLGELMDASSVPHLLEATVDRDDDVRSESHAALQKFHDTLKNKAIPEGDPLLALTLLRPDLYPKTVREVYWQIKEGKKPKWTKQEWKAHADLLMRNERTASSRRS